MKPIIVYCTDGNDIQFLKASIFSVRKYIKDVDIYVLSDTLDKSVLNDVTILDPTIILNSLGFFSNRWGRKWPYATLYRMAIPLMDEFKDVDTVVYLDTDTLVLSENVKQLVEANVGEYEILGAKDSNGTWTRMSKCIRSDLSLQAAGAIIQKLWSKRQLEGTKYINAGVAVWNLKKIRENDLEWYRQRLKWFWEAELKCGFDFLDQDFINTMMYTDPNMSNAYNAFYDRSNVPASIKDEDIVIRHYIKGSKGKMLELAESLGFNPADGAPERIVVYASDGKDSARLIASMNSVRKHLGLGTKFFILTDLEQYPGVFDATIIHPMPYLQEIGLTATGWNRKWPVSCLYRLAIPLLPEFADYNNVLYLDTDTLVRSSSANKLFDLQSNGYECYGVSDVPERQWEIEAIIRDNVSYEAKQQLKKRLWDARAKEAQSYINSGVLMLFLNTIRENGLDWYKQRIKWFLDYIYKGAFKHPDQDFINVFMDVNPSISVRYNKFSGEKNENCVIQHFVAGAKPYMMGVAKHLGFAK